MLQEQTIEREICAQGAVEESSSWPASAFSFSSASLGHGEAHPKVQLNFSRNEIKYLLDAEALEAVQEAMQGRMVPDEWGPTTICNLYYDTPTCLLARRSDEHPLYKEKIRLRSYGQLFEGEPVYLELKKKFDGITYKRRCGMDPARAKAFLSGAGDPATQIERELDFAIRRYEGLAPRALIAYEREAFYAEDDHGFRMTFDAGVRARTTELELASGTHGLPLLADGLTLMELKCGGAIPLWLVDVLSREGLRKARFSKYGTAWHELIEPRIRWNALVA